MNYQFTFLRHGESEGNKNDYVQGQHDFPLSQDGVAQAQSLAQQWLMEDVQFDTIITSPLTRARNTAEIIQSFIISPLKIDPIWMERHRGKHQGLTKEELSQKYPRPDFIQLYDRLGETGESEWQLYLRAGTAVQSLFQNPPGSYLVVSHGGLLDKVLHIIFGIKLQANFQGLHFDFSNTTYTRIDYDLDRNQWQMIEFAQSKYPQRINSHKSYHFTFVRHGESQGNVDKIFQGQSETPLTALGQTQAHTLGKIFSKRGINYDKVFSSPQLRAMQTANLICQFLNLEIEICPLLKEINNGKLAGMKGEDIDIQFGARPDRANPYLPVGEMGESWHELYLRGMKIIDSLISIPPGDYLIISHGALLNSLLMSILGIPPQPSRRSVLFHFENTGFCELNYSSEENLWRFLSFNPAPKISTG